jgi:DNA-binding transcriptional regulator YiaG
MIKSAKEKREIFRRLPAIIQAELKWREQTNRISQQQAVDVMKARGFPMTLSTLKKWEAGYLRPGKYASLALEKFLAEHAVINDAPVYPRQARIVKADRKAEIRAARRSGKTLLAVAKEFGLSESGVSRICAANRRAVKKSA